MQLYRDSTESPLLCPLLLRNLHLIELTSKYFGNPSKQNPLETFWWKCWLVKFFWEIVDFNTSCPYYNCLRKLCLTFWKIFFSFCRKYEKMPNHFASIFKYIIDSTEIWIEKKVFFWKFGKHHYTLYAI